MSAVMETEWKVLGEGMMVKTCRRSYKSSEEIQATVWEQSKNVVYAIVKGSGIDECRIDFTDASDARRWVIAILERI